MSRSKVFSVLERIEKLSKEALCLVSQMCSLIEEALGDMTSFPSLSIPKCSATNQKIMGFFTVVSGTAATTCKLKDVITAQKGRKTLLRYEETRNTFR